MFDRHDNSQVVIDVLLIDMNGIIHNSAQEVYGYGSFLFQRKSACDKKVIHWCVDRLTEWLYKFKTKGIDSLYRRSSSKK